MSDLFLNKVKKNFIYLSLYKIFELSLPLVTSPLLARKLGAQSLGIYVYTYSIVSIYTVIAELGVYRYGMREIAKVRDNQKKLNQTYTDIFFTHAINATGVFFIYLLSIPIFNMDNKFIFFLQSGNIIAVLLDNAFFYVGIEDIRDLSIRDGAVKLVSFIGIFFLIHRPSDLALYTLLMVLSSLVSRIVALIYAKKYTHFTKPSWSKIKLYYPPMVLLMIPALSLVVYDSMDKIMIGRFYSKAEVAYYDAASRVLIVKNIISSLGTVMAPRLANLFAKRKNKEAMHEFEYSMEICLIMAYLFMSGFIVVANQFAPLFWGEQFSRCATLMSLLSICIPIWTVGEVIRNQYLLPIGKDKEYAASFIVGVSTNIVFNLFFIPSDGAIGSIYATLIAETAMSGVQLWFVRKELRFYKTFVYTMPYLLISLSMIIFVKSIVLHMYVDNMVKLILETLFGSVYLVVLIIVFELISGRKLLINVMKKY